jgi:hypothetical protein
MVGHVVTALRQSPLVRDLEIGAMIDEANVQLLRVRAELIDGSLLCVREASFPHTSKYSYHWQTSTGEMLLCWDNAPHHPEIPTHPHHKHDGERIGPAARVSIEDVLTELATRLQSKGDG